MSLRREYGVERLEVFGSAANGRFDPERSDFDFIATFAEKDKRIADRFFEFIDALEALLGRPLHLLTDFPIRNPYLRKSFNASRRDLYVKTE